MGRTETEVQPGVRAEPNPHSLKTIALGVGLAVGLVLLGVKAWDVVDALHFEAVSSPDAGAGYGNAISRSISSGQSARRSPGYSTGPDDKNYLRLPGVPDSPARPR